MRQLSTFYKSVEAGLRRHPILTGFVVVTIAALLALSRRPDLFLHAQFWAEDGAVWYTDAYHNGFWATIIKPYPEYIAVPQRIIAWLSTLLPLQFAPLFFNACGLVMHLIPAFLLASGRLKHIVPSYVVAVVIALLFVAQPNSAEVFSSFANAQWHLALAALLILVSPAQKHKVWRAFDIAVIIAAGLSGPAAILLVPIVAVYWWVKKTPVALQNMVCIALLAAAQLASIVFSTYHRAGADPATSLFGFAKIIGGQIFAGGLLGQDNISLFYLMKPAQYIFVGACLLLIIYAVVKGPLWLKLLNAYAALQVTVMFISLKNQAGSTIDIWKGLINPTAGQRYWYIPIAVWLATLLWLAWYAKQTVIQGIAITFVALWLMIGIPQDWSLPPMVDYQFKDYAARLDTTPKGEALVIPINPAGWKMTLYKQ